MTARQQRRLWRHVESIENFWQTLAEIEPGVVSRLATIATDRRWEIIFLTKRPETAGATAQVQTQRWLESKGFALPSVFVVQGSRGRIAASLGLDIVVDDRPENCLDVVVDSKARALLVWREDEGAVARRGETARHRRHPIRRRVPRHPDADRFRRTGTARRVGPRDAPARFERVGDRLTYHCQRESAIADSLRQTVQLPIPPTSKSYTNAELSD